jgi:hypothetical protein
VYKKRASEKGFHGEHWKKARTPVEALSSVGMDGNQRGRGIRIAQDPKRQILPAHVVPKSTGLFAEIKMTGCRRFDLIPHDCTVDGGLLLPMRKRPEIKFLRSIHTMNPGTSSK